MIFRKLAVQRIALKVSLYAAFTASFWFADWLRFRSGWIPIEHSFRPSDYLVLYIVSVVVWGTFSRLFQLDQLWVASSARHWSRRGAWAILSTLMGLSFGAFFVRSTSFSRLFVVLLGVFNAVALLAVRQALLLLARRQSGHAGETRILLVGDSTRAGEISEILSKNAWVRCSVIGYLSVNAESHQGGIPRLGSLESLESVCRQHGPDEILLAVPLTHLGRLADLKRALGRVSVPARLVCDFLQELGTGASLHDFFGMPVIDLHRNPGDTLVYGLLKRSFDLVVASVLLVLLMPLIILVAILVKLTSPGPALFSQRRVGLHGRPFTLHKFRSMRLQSQETSDSTWTTSNDHRCTPLGRYLRKLGLDELPQIWNVLRGDMSLVGPRPERPFFAKKFTDEIEGYNVRHFLKSGITGWAQVNGLRGDTSIAKRIEYDLYYLTHWSFAMDLRILWLTLWRGFGDPSAQ